MAAGGDPPNKYYIFIGGKEEKTTIVRGDKVEAKHEIQAREIGVVNASAPAAQNQEASSLEQNLGQMNLNSVAADGVATRWSGSMASEQAVAKRTTTAQDVKAQILIEKGAILFSKSDYAGAMIALDEPCVLEANHFLSNLLLAECYMHLGKSHRANEMIDAVRNIVTSSGLKPDEVKEYAADFINESLYTRAIIFLRIASDLFKSSASSPDDLVNWIYSCVSKTDDATRPMIEAGGQSRKIGIQYGITFMTQMFNQLVDVKNANPVNTAKKEAWLRTWIGFNYNSVGEYVKSIEIREIGVKKMERQFGSNASKYKIYGNLLHNLGVGHWNLDKFSKAESYYVKAVEAYEKATDYGDESEKQKDIEKSKQRLKNTRAKLGKTG